MRTWIKIIAFFLICNFLFCGCASVRITDPSRTATEQFLLSEAAVKAVNSLSFEAIQGRVVYIDANNFAPAEKEFVFGEFRAGLLTSGVRISSEKKEAEITLELRSGGVGIDRYEYLFGIPAFVVPSAATSNTVNIITPEIAITKKIRQVAFASVGYIAYWSDTGEVVSSSGPSIGKTFREDWWIFGLGPTTIGNIPPVDYKYE